MRNFDGTFYEQVYPFDPFYFSTKVHPTGSTSFHPAPFTTYVAATHHSPCSICEKSLPLLSTIPRYWLEDDGTMELLDRYRWRSDKTIRWLKVCGLVSVPCKIQEELGALVSNLDKYQDQQLDVGGLMTRVAHLMTPRLDFND